MTQVTKFTELVAALANLCPDTVSGTQVILQQIQREMTKLDIEFNQSLAVY